jgi:hypothetical protein
MEHLVEEARSLNLMVSSGSDFHGELIKPGIGLGDSSGEPDDQLITMLLSMTVRG